MFSDIVDVDTDLWVVRGQHHLLAVYPVVDVSLSRKRFQAAHLHPLRQLLYPIEERMIKSEQFKVRKHVTGRMVAV